MRESAQAQEPGSHTQPNGTVPSPSVVVLSSPTTIVSPGGQSPCTIGCWLHVTVTTPGILPAVTDLLHTMKSLLLPSVTTREPLLTAHLMLTVTLPVQESKPGVLETEQSALPLR